MLFVIPVLLSLWSPFLLAPIYLLSFPTFFVFSTSSSLLSTLYSYYYFHPHAHQHTNTQLQRLVMTPSPSAEPQVANDTPFQQAPPPPSANTTPAATHSEQLAIQVKPPLATTYSSASSIPQSTTPTSALGAQGGGGAGGFLATVRHAATDILGISLPASAPSAGGGEADPNGISNSNSNNNSNYSNGDINGTETMVRGGGGGDEEARRHGNISGNGKPFLRTRQCTEQKRVESNLFLFGRMHLFMAPPYQGFTAGI